MNIVSALLSKVRNSRFQLFGLNGTVLVIVMWMAFIFITLVGYSLSNMKAFDPLGEMTFTSTLINYDDQLEDFLVSRGVVPGTVVHLTGKRNCLCDDLAQDLRTELDSTLNEDGFNSITMSVGKEDKLRQFVASTPSVIVFNKAGGVSYVGPYAEGMGCFSGYGNELDLIVSQAKLDKQIGAVVNSDALGCYCYQ